MSPSLSDFTALKPYWRAVAVIAMIVGVAPVGTVKALPYLLGSGGGDSAAVSELSARVANLQGDAHTTHSEPIARSNSDAIEDIGKIMEGIRILWARNEVYLRLLCDKADILLPAMPEMMPP